MKSSEHDGVGSGPPPVTQPRGAWAEGVLLGGDEVTTPGQQQGPSEGVVGFGCGLDTLVVECLLNQGDRMTVYEKDGDAAGWLSARKKVAGFDLPPPISLGGGGVWGALGPKKGAGH